MKRLFSFSIAIAISLTSLNAQFEVNTDGEAKVGDLTFDQGDKDFTVTDVHQPR